MRARVVGSRREQGADEPAKGWKRRRRRGGRRKRSGGGSDSGVFSAFLPHPPRQAQREHGEIPGCPFAAAAPSNDTAASCDEPHRRAPARGVPRRRGGELGTGDGEEFRLDSASSSSSSLLRRSKGLPPPRQQRRRQRQPVQGDDASALPSIDRRGRDGEQAPGAPADPERAAEHGSGVDDDG